MKESDFYANERYTEQYGRAETIGTYTAKAFLWMFLGLLVTFGVSMALYASGLVVVIQSSFLFIALPIVELVVVVVLVGRIERISVPVARALFLAYAALNGVVFTTYFAYFDAMSLILVFGATALYFGALAAYGYVTKADLSRLRPILVGGLICLILFGILSLFLPLGALDRVMCLAGIAIFLGFTAYDTQKIKHFYALYAGDNAMLAKASIYSALQLYLDFVNLFLYLLRFLGRRKN